jgi:hypothetical protein
MPHLREELDTFVKGIVGNKLARFNITSLLDLRNMSIAGCW